MKAVCRVCGNEFNKLGRSVTCSSKCSDINRKRHYEKYKINNKSNRGVYAECKICGEKFRKYGTTLTCSAKCREINNRNLIYAGTKKWVKKRQKDKKGICKICGKEFLKNGSSTKCCSDECRVVNSKRREYAKSKKKELKRQLQRIVSKICPVCGKTFKGNGNKYFCSEDCRTLHRKRQKSLKKISKRFAGREIDLTITLDALVERDNNICYICGEICDSNDFTIVNGNTICGNKYPSIDHVIPASKGGTHTWDNVKLAHRICNSYKCDSLYKENKEGQMEMFV